MGLLWSEGILWDRNWSSSFTFILGQVASFRFHSVAIRKRAIIWTFHFAKSVISACNSLCTCADWDVLRLVFSRWCIRFTLQEHLDTWCSRALGHPVEHPSCTLVQPTRMTPVSHPHPSSSLLLSHIILLQGDYFPPFPHHSKKWD